MEKLVPSFQGQIYLSQQDEGEIFPFIISSFSFIFLVRSCHFIFSLLPLPFQMHLYSLLFTQFDFYSSLKHLLPIQVMPLFRMCSLGCFHRHVLLCLPCVCVWTQHLEKENITIVINYSCQLFGLVELMLVIKVIYYLHCTWFLKISGFYIPYASSLLQLNYILW